MAQNRYRTRQNQNYINNNTQKFTREAKLTDYFADKGNIGKIGHLLEYPATIAAPPLDIVDAPKGNIEVPSPDLKAEDLYKRPTNRVRLTSEGMSGLGFVVEVTLPSRKGTNESVCMRISFERK